MIKPFFFGVIFATMCCSIAFNSYLMTEGKEKATEAGYTTAQVEQMDRLAEALK